MKQPRYHAQDLLRNSTSPRRKLSPIATDTPPPLCLDIDPLFSGTKISTTGSVRLLAPTLDPSRGLEHPHWESLAAGWPSMWDFF